MRLLGARALRANAWRYGIIGERGTFAACGRLTRVPVPGPRKRQGGGIESMARKQGSASQAARPGAAGARAAEDPPGDLSAERLLGMYRVMVTTRAVDERMWLLQRQGAIAFTIPCKGQEAAQIGAIAAFDPSRDWFYPYYRDVGVMLSLGMTPKDV